MTRTTLATQQAAMAAAGACPCVGGFGRGYAWRSAVHQMSSFAMTSDNAMKRPARHLGSDLT